MSLAPSFRSIAYLPPVLLLVVAIPSLIAWKFFDPFPIAELSAGWILATLNAAAAFAINRSSVGTPPRVFLVRAIIGNVTRVIILLCLIALYRWAGKWSLLPFLISLMTGFFIFLILEILSLHSIAVMELGNGSGSSTSKHQRGVAGGK